MGVFGYVVGGFYFDYVVVVSEVIFVVGDGFCYDSVGILLGW